MRIAFTPETIQAVHDMLECSKENDDPDINTCRHSELGLSPTTFSRIIKHHLHCHCLARVQLIPEERNTVVVSR